MEYKYYLPNNQGVREEYYTECNSIFIIGANGSGKSRLGAWMEKQNAGMFYRIAGQRSLTFNDNIPLRNIDEANNQLFFGHQKAKDRTYKYGNINKYTLKMVQDYDDALSDLLAEYRQEIDLYYAQCKKAEEKNIEKPLCPVTIIDKLMHIWDIVFPHRKLIFERDKFLVEYEGKKYNASEMSDGERAVLYLSAITLCTHFEKFIIDEPELHLHPSIMHNLWKALEKEKRDILFIYITHDIDFIMSHYESDKVWIKSFNGDKYWEYSIIKNNNIPENLIIDILGIRENILLVEGEENSIDYTLYSAIFPKYHIIPCGSCNNVISKTKTLKELKNTLGYNYSINGLIDRDYRCEQEINDYKKDGIYVLEVAEVENLLIVPEVIDYMARKISLEENIEKAKEYIIDTKFKNELNKQINEKLIAEIKYQLSIIDVNCDNDAMIKKVLENVCKSDFVDNIKRNIQKEYNEKYESRDLREILKIYNCKDLYKHVGKYIGYDNDMYYSSFINCINEKRNDELLCAINKYIPGELQ